LFAHISVYWSLLEISEEDIKNGNISYKEPNPAQIVAILCLLGADYDDNLYNSIAHTLNSNWGI
jgi:hypothetical protein